MSILPHPDSRINRRRREELCGAVLCGHQRSAGLQYHVRVVRPLHHHVLLPKQGTLLPTVFDLEAYNA